MSEPAHYPREFSTPVHGTVFARRLTVVQRLHEGEELLLVPDPPSVQVPAVWVHARGGDVIGYLPEQIAEWLAPWMLGGGRTRARVERLGSGDVASWNRLVVHVERLADPAR